MSDRDLDHREMASRLRKAQNSWSTWVGGMAGNSPPTSPFGPMPAPGGTSQISIAGTAPYAITAIFDGQVPDDNEWTVEFTAFHVHRASLSGDGTAILPPSAGVAHGYVKLTVLDVAENGHAATFRGHGVGFTVFKGGDVIAKWDAPDSPLPVEGSPWLPLEKRLWQAREPLTVELRGAAEQDIRVEVGFGLEDPPGAVGGGATSEISNWSHSGAGTPSAAASSITAPSISVVDGALLLSMGGQRNNNSLVSHPSGMTLLEHDSASGPQAAGVATATAAGGETGDKTWTWSGSTALATILVATDAPTELVAHTWTVRNEGGPPLVPTHEGGDTIVALVSKRGPSGHPNLTGDGFEFLAEYQGSSAAGSSVIWVQAWTKIADAEPDNYSEIDALVFLGSVRAT